MISRRTHLVDSLNLSAFEVSLLKIVQIQFVTKHITLVSVGSVEKVLNLTGIFSNRMLEYL